MSPLTTGDFSDSDPRWSPDLKEIAVSSNRASARALYRINIAGGTPQPFMAWDRGFFAVDDWSSTGVLLYHIAGEPALFARNGEGEEIEAARVVTGIVDQAHFSPDGRFPRSTLVNRGGTTSPSSRSRRRASAGLWPAAVFSRSGQRTDRNCFT